MNQQIKIVLFDTEESYRNLLPLSYIHALWLNSGWGINRIVDKWRHFVDAVYSYYPPEYLQEKFPIGIGGEEALFIAGNLLPDASMAGAVMSLGRGEALRDSGRIMGFPRNSP